MKPRLYLRYGIWHCATFYRAAPSEIEYMRTGYGYTPADAFADWARQA